MVFSVLRTLYMYTANVRCSAKAIFVVRVQQLPPPTVVARRSKHAFEPPSPQLYTQPVNKKEEEASEGDMRVCYVTGKGGKQPFYAGRREGGKVVALYWPLLSPSFSHIQEDKKLERKLKKMG